MLSTDRVTLSSPPPAGTLKGYLRRDQSKKQVYVRSRPAPGARTAVTRYRTLSVRQELSLLECDLVTGRTHQIRAQLAAAGHPLLGDGKYGSEKINRKYRRSRQALWSWSLEFRFTTPAGPLEGLNGRRWQVDRVDFVERYFPDYQLERAAKPYVWNG